MTETLEAARADLREHLLAGEAVPCPCCTQLAKIYRRRIHSTMARNLVAMYRTAPPDGWVHVPTLVSSLGVRNGGDEGKLAHWGLIEAATERRDDGGKSGWWKLTNLGRSFARNTVSVPKYAVLYDGNLQRLEGELVTVDDCLGERFDYRELMDS